jgi:hypothetical protein
MFRCAPVLGVDPRSFTESERKALARSEEFVKTGRGYDAIQSTKVSPHFPISLFSSLLLDHLRTQPFTIGLALATSPLALLAYIGEKMHAWSDPTTLDPADVLDTVALYYLSHSFATSVLIYNQSKQVREEMTLPQGDGERQSKWQVGSKIGFTLFVSTRFAFIALLWYTEILVCDAKPYEIG